MTTLSEAVERVRGGIAMLTSSFPNSQGTADLTLILAALEARTEALKVARHGLVTLNNLRATDLTVDQFNTAIMRSPRHELEFMTDATAEISAIDQALTEEPK